MKRVVEKWGKIRTRDVENIKRLGRREKCDKVMAAMVEEEMMKSKAGRSGLRKEGVKKNGGGRKK